MLHFFLNLAMYSIKLTRYCFGGTLLTNIQKQSKQEYQFLVGYYNDHYEYLEYVSIAAYNGP